MAEVDQKYAFNTKLLQEAEQQKTNIETYLESLDDPSSEVRAYIRDEIRQIDLRVEGQLISIDSKEWGQNVSVTRAETAQQVAYGFCRIGGNLMFATADQGESGEFLHVFVALTGHEIDRITDIYLDGQKVDFPATVDANGRRRFLDSQGEWVNSVFASVVSRGAEDQAANPDLVYQSNLFFTGKWTEAHRLRGTSGVYLRLFYTAEKFINGFPEISFEGKWKNDIYDPRTDSTGWSSNAVLCFANYLMDTKFGPGFSVDQIDMDSLANAAQVCDQNVTKNGGGTEKRYTVNGAFRASQGNNHARIIEHFRNSFGGDAVYSGGKWRFYMGNWRVPVISLSEKDLRGSLEVEVRPSREDIYNAVAGKYRSAENFWELTDYPTIKNSTYEGQDGRRLVKEMDLPFTSSPATAQRIAKIKLEDLRQWIRFDTTFGAAGLKLRAGTNFKFSNEELGWVDKPFTVLKQIKQLRLNEGTGPVCEVRILAKETAEGIYDWNDGEETVVDLAPNTRLPDPSKVRKPGELTLSSGTAELAVRADGTVFSRIKVTWPQSTDPFVLTGGQHEIQYKQSSVSTWRNAGFVSGTENTTYILDFQDGELYDVRVRATTPFGRSAWSQELGFEALGKEEPPSGVSNLQVVPTPQGTRVTWDRPPDKDYEFTEGRLGSWEGESLFSESGGRALLRTFQAGEHFIHVRHWDTSGNDSEYSSVAAFSVSPPSPPQNFEGLVVYNLVRLTWTPPATTTFPVAGYKLKKGSTYAGAQLLGEFNATVKTFNEQTKGRYTYWLVAVDIHGNESEPVSITLQVDSPPLFELLYDQIVNPALADSLSNAVLENGDIVAPLKTTEIYSAHFTGNSWSTPQDQVSAGYPLFAQPSNTSDSVWVQTIDYGAVLQGALISLQLDPMWKAGSGDITVDIAYSDDDVSYTTATGVVETFASNFRYVRITLTISGDDDTSIVRLPYPRLKLQVKTEQDRGKVTANAGDASGTPVTYNKTFLDIFEDTIQVTYKGSSAYFVAFAYSTNTLFVFLWDKDGNRVSGDVNWSVEGIISEF